MMGFFPFAQIETVSPRPLLFIVGERAVSAYFSEDAYSRAVEPKELVVIPGPRMSISTTSLSIPDLRSRSSTIFSAKV
jgi:hypothetical protein